jgi:hypothetical protein
MHWCAGLAISLVMAGGSTRADDQADATKIIDKAIGAMGGEAKVSKYKASTFKVKGIFHGMGNPIPYTGEFAVQFPDKSRNVIEADVGGQKFAFTIVVNGDKGWRKMGDDVQEMDKDMMAEQKENLYANYVTSLAPLHDKSYKLSPLGESKVGDQAVVGVKVSHEGHREVKLYFDKKTGMLVKSEHRVKDEAGQESNQESVFSNYKEVDGVQEPMKMTVKRDGNLYLEGENSDLKHAEKLDDGLFNKP